MERLIEKMNKFGISTSTIQTGVYKVKGDEVMTATLRQFTVSVVFLDDTSHQFILDKKAKGAELLELVFQHLELREREFFGLVFCEGGSVLTAGPAPDVTRWLDPNKYIRKQMRLKGSGQSVMLYLRVKFYVTDPSRLHDEFTRFLFYLQVKSDLMSGRLLCPMLTVCLLTSYCVQSSLGDYDPDNCLPGYLTPFSSLRSHCDENLDVEEIERRITELHRLHKGQSPADAELNFLEHAKRLEMYGIALHPGKDSSGRDIQLGVTSFGLVVFQNNIKINTFSWSKIVKISFKRKQFFIQLRKEISESYDTILGFNLSSYRSCKNVWKAAVEHHSFFRLQSPKLSSRRFHFTLGSRFRYSGRTEFQAITEPTHTTSATMQRVTQFSAQNGSRQNFRQTLPLHLERKQRMLASPEHSSIGSSKASQIVSSRSSCPPSSHAPSPPPSSLHQPSKPRFSVTSSRVSLAVRAYESFNSRVQSLGVRVVPRRAWTEEADDGGFLSRTMPRVVHGGSGSSGGSSPSAAVVSSATLDRSPPMSRGAEASRITLEQRTSPLVVDLSKPPALFSYADDSSSEKGSERALSEPADFGGKKARPSSIYLEPFSRYTCPTESSNGSTNLQPLTGSSPKQQQVNGPPPPPPTSSTSSKESSTSSHHGRDESSTTSAMSHDESRDRSAVSPEDKSSVSSISLQKDVTTIPPPNLSQTKDKIETNSEQGGSQPSNPLVVITMMADGQGRFGFNVKGGCDQGVPVIVSRVAGGTPADTCIPRLAEGDQVVMINGSDICNLTHDQVVNCIRAARKPHLGKLVLAVKQNAYLGEDVEEPVFQYVPEKCLSPAWPAVHQQGAHTGHLTALQQSMLLLAESLESGAICGQFEQVYRKNPGLAITDSHLPQNANKNRYKDISPYNCTRVVLADCPGGDYINANYVDMDISNTDIVNKYIATQGPLSHTCMEFWYMVWEQECDLLIMLTTVVERGRTKCHKYWPNLDSTVMYGSISVTCTREESRDNFAYRDFTLIHADLPEDGRVVTQMQYLSWPDHGTPDDSTQFVEFVEQVREMRCRSENKYPVLVHCSAGIGRTGVLILMETALCLVEQDQPVYPLHLTKTMRDQRPAMIQTPSQYRFVCEAITNVYKTGRVQPLSEVTTSSS